MSKQEQNNDTSDNYLKYKTFLSVIENPISFSESLNDDILLALLNDNEFISLLTDKNFLSYLKFQVRGVFNNHDINCIHSLIEEKNASLNNFNYYSKMCFTCLQIFILGSEFKQYFKKLYKLFKQVSIIPQDDIQTGFLFCPLLSKDMNKFIKSILKCPLSQEEVSYFCSPWLDGLFADRFLIYSSESTISSAFFKILCLKGHLETLKWFCKCNDDLTIKRSKGFSFSAIQKGFKFACMNGHLDILKILLSKKIQTKTIQVGFKYACENGHPDVVNFLLGIEESQKVDYKNIQYGFIDACRKNQKDVVDFLLKLNNNQKIDQKTIQTGFRKACIFSNLEILECLIKLKKDQEVLQDTIRYNLSYTYKRDKVISLLLNINEYRKNQ